MGTLLMSIVKNVEQCEIDEVFWTQHWGKLKLHDWTNIQENGKLLYLAPGIDSPSDGKLGRDVFDRKADVLRANNIKINWESCDVSKTR